MKLSVRLRALAAVGLLGFAAACGGDSSADTEAAAGPAETLRLGYFANVTHATPNVGIGKGFFAKALGETELKTQIFNAGPAAIEAIFAGSLDATYIGPNPAINAYAKSKGEAIRIIAGATTGGAALVVNPSITSADQLKGKKIASPQLGGTQDVALRAWLAGEGLKTNPKGGGDVSIVPQENAQTLELFKEGEIDGAWVPEPWASRLVLQGGGKVLVDERDLWPNGQFVTTHLIVATDFLEKHPETVKALLTGAVETTAWINDNPDEAKTVLNAELKRITSKALPADVIDRAFANITVTDDPVASSLSATADNAKEAGLLGAVELEGIYDLRLLNEVLTAAGKSKIKTDGLGEE